jgi:para-nitrobenzyl esterase
VTVFGESAGAMSIGDLLSMPRADGLFRRAALESGGAHHVIPAAEAARIGARLAEALGVPATREEIAQVPVARFLEAQAQIDAEVVSSPDPARWGAEVVASLMPFHPVVDGDVLPAPPIDRIVSGASADVDILVGTNADDWRFSPVLGGFIDQITEAVLTGPVETYGFWSIAAYGLRPETALPHYRATRFGGAPGDVLGAVMTDWWVRVPAMRLSACRPCAWRTRMPPRRAAPSCTSSPGRHRSWAVAWAPATRSKCRSSSTPSTCGTGR